MKDTLAYKGFTGSVHFSADDKVFHGKLMDINDLVTFDGETVDELINAFHDATDDYLALCKEVGKEPAKAPKGSFNVRISPQLHGQAIRAARIQKITLNKLVQTALAHEVKRLTDAPAKRKKEKKMGECHS
ncbi:MAG: type II toxin-antitoxin system HicB family antitoxin [Deltaproteobacteria bacterium]|nr:type II toxin-antitoxin system HicB family antitoxin [Deltaproteobacteria bacterium]